jgi:hypothetical protein
MRSEVNSGVVRSRCFGGTQTGGERDRSRRQFFVVKRFLDPAGYVRRRKGGGPPEEENIV